MIASLCISKHSHSNTEESFAIPLDPGSYWKMGVTTKPEHLGSILRTHMVNAKSRLLKVVH